MKKSTHLLHILCVEIWLLLIPVSLLAQQRVVISPFYSDYGILTDSLPKGWSPSPYIQLGVRVEFPQEVMLSELKQYKFENSMYFSDVIRPFIPVTLQYGQLRWSNLTFMNWNTPDLSEQELHYLEARQGHFSLSYNDCSFMAGSLRSKNGTPSFSYIHYEGWDSLFPTNAQRADTTTYILHVNPSLFYLMTDKGMVDLYTTESITILPREKYPSLFLFYKPIYEYRTVQYKGLNISLLAEKEDLAAQLYHKTSSDTIGKGLDAVASSATDSIPADSVIHRALEAIDHIAAFSGESPKNIAIAKTGLRFSATMGQRDTLDTLSASFSLTLDSVLLVEHEMFYQPTLLHELLHFVIGKQQDLSEDLSAQEKNFFAESVTEYLAKYLFGKHIAHKNMFADSIKQKPVNPAMLKEARHSIQANTTVSVGVGSDGTANTAWVYYDLLPILLHQLAESAQLDEEAFARAVYRYVKGNDGRPQTLQDFFSYLVEEQGFHLQKRQKNNISFLLGD